MSTQVILTAAVENLGAEGDVVAVQEGFARNFLIPQKLAMPASPANLRRIEALRKKREAEHTAKLAETQAVAEKLAKISCTINTPAGADGKLYGSVTAADIAAVLQAEGVTVERRKILLAQPIRELGAFDVEIKLHAEVSAKIKVWVVAAQTTAATVPVAETPKAEKGGKKK
jgi:large subunit ribosomal protein L9